jgi:hypothetical protein
MNPKSFLKYLFSLGIFELLICSRNYSSMSDNIAKLPDVIFDDSHITYYKTQNRDSDDTRDAANAYDVSVIDASEDEKEIGGICVEPEIYCNNCPNDVCITYDEYQRKTDNSVDDFGTMTMTFIHVDFWIVAYNVKSNQNPGPDSRVAPISCMCFLNPEEPIACNGEMDAATAAHLAERMVKVQFNLQLAIVFTVLGLVTDLYFGTRMIIETELAENWNSVITMMGFIMQGFTCYFSILWLGATSYDLSAELSMDLRYEGCPEFFMQLNENWKNYHTECILALCINIGQMLLKPFLNWVIGKSSYVAASLEAVDVVIELTELN